MNKTEFVDLLVQENQITKAQADRVINFFTEGVKKALRNSGKNNGTLQLIGFGTFKVLHQEARAGRNPQTGASIDIKASNRPTFSAGQKLKDAVN